MHYRNELLPLLEDLSDVVKDLSLLHSSMESNGRIHNFGAGPAGLPLEVIREVSDSLPNLNESGFGLLEISHRSEVFQKVIDEARESVRRVLSIPEEYKILFLQGGASLQFYMTALNILREGEKADYLITGGWSKKALKEASRIGDAKNIWSDETNGFRKVPKDGEYDVRNDTVYLHYTSNNTLYGTQYHHLPNSNGKPLVVDASSDITGVEIDVSKHDIVYAGAQKNLGPSGITLVILSPWAVSRIGNDIPTMLDYNVHIEKGSMFNTPNTFGIFVLGRVFAWLERNGGMKEAIRRNKEKSDLLYEELDRTDFWKPHAAIESRSKMNVTWRLKDTSLEEIFLKEASDCGLGGLKGHRSVGGIRASLYNYISKESVIKLVRFMKKFEEEHR
tara:strand:+ start:3287 stop:4459 length:1173 start_codon:yes stop_codon:yes gene_type:complete